MNEGEAVAVNGLYRGLLEGRLQFALGALSALMGRAHQVLSDGATEAEVEAWGDSLPGYLVLGDQAAARAGDWGWLQIGDDSRPAELADVLLRQAGPAGEPETDLGFLRRDGRYQLTGCDELRMDPPPTHWMPLPGVGEGV
jgi:hypothetical protein